MKRLVPIAISILMLFGFIIGYSSFNTHSIYQNKDKMIYYNSDVRNSCIEAMDSIIDENSILMMGSSELSSSDNIGYPPSLFKMGNSDFNIIMMGKGNMQSLHHAISIGALADGIENKKVVLIISPQWFTTGHLTGETFASVFSERLFDGMVRSEDVSYKTKRKIADRVESLLIDGNYEEYKRIKLYDDVYIEKNASIAEYAQIMAWNQVTDNKQKKDLLSELSAIEYNASEDKVEANSIDYKSLLEYAEQEGIEACASNDWYMYDYYFTTYVEPNLAVSKNSNAGSSYLESPEYEDFELFLTVCEETGINPLIVSIPVNGMWYDYTGFTLDGRQAYYQKIRDICNSRGVSILDFSDKEYEPYFLKDIMHLGWKGWVYLDEGVYRYYLGDDSERCYPFDLKVHAKETDNGIEYKLLNHISDVKDIDMIIGSETVPLTKCEDGYYIGIGKEYLNYTEIKASGVYGAGITGKAKVSKTESVLDNIVLSDGVIINDGQYVFSTNVEGNVFNSIAFQLYDVNGSFIANLNIFDSTGTISKQYTHDLPAGDYTFVLKANSNKADESISYKTYLDTGDIIDYGYSIDELSDTKATISNIFVWRVKYFE